MMSWLLLCCVGFACGAGDAEFPDYAPEVLIRQCQHFTPGTAWYQQFSAEVTPVPCKSHAVLVSQHIVDIIPVAVHELLGCHDGRPLYVMRDWSFVDFCSGIARVTRWFEFYGHRGSPFDKLYNKNMDVTTLPGLAIAIVFVLRIIAGGVCIGGPECSTWVWIARGHTKRSITNIMGDQTRSDISEGNRMNLAVSILCTIMASWGVFWLMENPVTTLFFKTVNMIAAIAHSSAKHVNLKLRRFGHQSAKPVTLVGTVPWLEDLCAQAHALPGVRGKPKVNFINFHTKSGRRACTGEKVGLAASKVYPVKFACALVQQHLGLVTRHTVANPSKPKRKGVKKDGGQKLRKSTK